MTKELVRPLRKRDPNSDPEAGNKRHSFYNGPIISREQARDFSAYTNISTRASAQPPSDKTEDK